MILCIVLMNKIIYVAIIAAITAGLAGIVGPQVAQPASAQQSTTAGASVFGTSTSECSASTDLISAVACSSTASPP